MNPLVTFFPWRRTAAIIMACDCRGCNTEGPPATRRVRVAGVKSGGRGIRVARPTTEKDFSQLLSSLFRVSDARARAGPTRSRTRPPPRLGNAG